MANLVYKKIEHLIDKLIPLCLVMIILLLIAEFGFHEKITPYYFYIEIIDYLVIGVFVADLYFKFHRLKDIKKFVKNHWLEIIAVFPFMILFRTIENILRIEVAARELKEAQMVLHETVEVSKVAKGAEATRTARVLKILRPLLRTPRLLKAVTFFEKPQHKY